VASDLALRFFIRLVHPVVRLAHRATLEGTEHLPASGPFLLVANHSGGLGIAEINSFIALYAARFGNSRPLAGFTHPLSFAVWPLSRLVPHIGAIPSTYAAAESTLGLGVPILVFPGGDHEAFRPIWEAYRVDFAGRLGFLRIARQARVPVVPMGIRGSHFTVAPLFRSRVLPYLFVWPRAVGVKRYPLTLLAALGTLLILWAAPFGWPVRMALAWLWAASPFAMIPWIPWTIRMRIGAPLGVSQLFPGAAEDEGDAELRGALATVEEAVQALVRGPAFSLGDGQREAFTDPRTP
jgi:1-acyl-sn-glycerol-3-phosphate acyltransferase